MARISLAFVYVLFICFSTNAYGGAQSAADKAKQNSNDGQKYAQLAQIGGSLAVSFGMAQYNAGTAMAATPGGQAAGAALQKEGYCYMGFGGAAIVAGIFSQQDNSGIGNAADNFKDQVTQNSGSADPANPAKPKKSNPAPITLSPEVTKAISDAKKAGVTIDPVKGVSGLPNGGYMTADQIKSGDFSTSGFTPGEVATAKTKLAEIANKLKDKMAAEDATSKGGAGGDSGAGAVAVDDFGAGKFGGSSRSSFLTGLDPTGGKKPVMPARKPSAVAGMSKKLANGESIGVAGDSIFNMITRRYEAVGSQDMFLGGN